MNEDDTVVSQAATLYSNDDPQAFIKNLDNLNPYLAYRALDTATRADPGGRRSGINTFSALLTRVERDTPPNATLLTNLIHNCIETYGDEQERDRAFLNRFINGIEAMDQSNRFEPLLALSSTIGDMYSNNRFRTFQWAASHLNDFSRDQSRQLRNVLQEQSAYLDRGLGNEIRRLLNR